MRLPTAQKLKENYPLAGEEERFVAASRRTISDILSGKDPRVAIIAGPCSIHDLASALEYAKRFKELASDVKKHAFLVMRAFVEKPRTTAGWKGLLYDPFLDGSNDIGTGLLWTRELFRELAYMQVPAATEFLDPLTAPFFDDLVSWGFIGARTCASQVHRQLASLLAMPVGFKNSVDGNIDLAIQGVVAARAPHTFLHLDSQGGLQAVQSEGNRYAHIVLRGGLYEPNYDPETVEQAIRKMHLAGIKQRLVIDCSHGNSQKDYLKQKEAFYATLEQIHSGREIAGLMLESHLEAGSQFFSESPSLLKSTLSVTDPCIDWAMTEELIQTLVRTPSRL